MNEPLPDSVANTDQLEDLLSKPTGAVVQAISKIAGDLIVLGAGGKMGPTLTRMAKRALDQAHNTARVYAVSRFSASAAVHRLEAEGIEVIRCDLLDEAALDRLPDAENVIYMAGRKFGATGNEGLTWAMNCYLPGRVCQRYRNSRIAAFSTGNVYDFTPVHRGGSLEGDALCPRGDYAMSCLGRERIFQHFSSAFNIPVALIRLNYACELRYGVLVDIAQKVWAEEPVDVTMGYMNVIWQGDANAMALQTLAHAASPPFPLNVAGPETLSVRQAAESFAERMGKEVRIEGEEASNALLSNGQLGHRLFGCPRVHAAQLIVWIADWVMRGGPSLGKPTHFEVRDGKF